MTIAIIGGTGFLGPEIAARLLARGHRPLVVARGRHKVQLPDGAIFAAADRMDEAALLALFTAHGVTALIDVFTLSLRNTAPVLAAASAVGAHYVLVSSVDVYSNYEGLLKKAQPPIRLEAATEDSPLRLLRYPYRANSRRPQGVEDDLFEDYDKLPLEDAARADPHLSATIVRLPMIFGPGDKQHRFGWAVHGAEAGKPFAIDSRAAGWLNSYLYVTDAADALALAATHPNAVNRTYNVGPANIRTVRQWADALLPLLGVATPIVEVPPEARGIMADRADASDLRYPLTLDGSRIRRELGYAEIVPEDEALLATIAYERATQRD